MNQRIIPISDESVNYITPFPKTPDPHPSKWLQGVQPWPSLPPTEYTRPLLTGPDRKAIVALLARHDSAEAVRAANDIPALVHLIREGERDGIGFTESAIACEKNKRALALLDVDAHNQAVAVKAACELEARPLAVKIALAMAGAFWTEFDAEVEAAEARLKKFGVPLSEQREEPGDVFTVYELHTEPAILVLYLRVWWLQHYFVGEFASPKFYGGTALGFLRDLTGEG